MTTYRGNEIPKPDRLDEDLKIVGARLGGMENVEEELNLPPSAEPDYLPKPGQKHYMETQPMADDKPFKIEDIPVGHSAYTLDPNARRRLDEHVKQIGPDKMWQGQSALVHEKGGPVQTKDPMPPDQRKLADRINVNEIMQMQDDTRAGGWGTTRETMPPPPTTQQYENGGRVKHGSSTVVSCKTKHGG